jgi:PAS domain S-box-containing protein
VSTLWRGQGSAGHARQFLGLGFLLLALVVGMSFFFAARERVFNGNAEARLLTSTRLSDLLSSLREAEAGQRGYLLTHDPNYLVPYNAALRDIPHELIGLDASLAGGPDAAALGTIHTLVAAKLAELSRTIALFQTGPPAAALAVVQMKAGMATMTQMRQVTSAIRADESARYQTVEETDIRDGEILRIATSAAIGFTLLLAWFAIRENRERNRQIRGAEAALRVANEALEMRVEERTRTLAASEAQFRSLAETLPGFVFVTGPTGGNTYVNPQFCAYTGLTAAQALRDGWAGCLHPDDVESTEAVWRQSLADAAVCEIECRFRRNDGVYRWFLCRSVPLRAADGKISGWIGSCTDIDERKHAEMLLSEDNVVLQKRVTERAVELERVFRLSGDILTVVDIDGRFRSLNPAWETITGHPVAETLGQRFADFVHPDDLSRTLETETRIQAGAAINGFENRYRRADGGYSVLSWRSVPIPEEGLIFGVARDVTQEKQREEQLRQSQKMEVVGQLTGGVAHDFNNLLTIIMGNLELLRRSLADAGPKPLQRVDTAMDGARRAAALTHRLLAFARRQPLAPQPVDANRLLAGMADMLPRTLGEDVSVELIVTPGVWMAEVDPNQLENAVLNLAVNARDAMPNGGRLTIETENVFLDRTYAAAHADVPRGEHVMIAVSDTGSGMTPEVQERVFEPFFTTKPQGQGTGLGLAQVYGFIKQSGGHVAIYSEAGHGTTVRLYLPRLKPVARTVDGPAAGLDAAPAGDSPAQGGQTILLVEDEVGVRKFAAEALQECGYHVLQAGNGDEALALLEETGGVDLLFTDVVLPGAINGRVLANEILRQRPQTLILFTTGYTRNAIIHNDRLDEGINFLGKPYSGAALGQTVQRLFTGASS